MEQFDVPRVMCKSATLKEYNQMLSQHEALRRATLLKHRKVSTQLKLDMVQRQLSDLRRTSPDSDNEREFYRLQMSQLSDELHDLGSTLDKVERNAFYAKRRILRQSGVDGLFSSSDGALPLSSSHPAIYSSSENLSRSGSRNSLKARVCHLMSSPNLKFKKKHLWGELRSVASLSSLNVKSSSQNSDDDVTTWKDSKPWKAPLRFLGKMVDSRIRRKFWISAKRTKSVDNIADNHVSSTKPSPETTFESKRGSLSFDSPEVRSHIDSSSSSSSSSSGESSDDDAATEDKLRKKSVPKYTWKAPVMRRISNNHNSNYSSHSNNHCNNNSSPKAQIDPAILAEIEDFEKMAAQYIKTHS